MATISEAEILKAAAEASLISSGHRETVSFPSSNSSTASVFSPPFVGSVTQSTETTAMATVDNIDQVNQVLGGVAEYENVPSVSENAIVRTGFEVNGKTFENVEALLAAHLMGEDDAGTSMKADHGSNTEFDEFEEMGDEVTYRIDRGGTKRGNDKLVDSLGFSYTLKNTKSNSGITYWWCTVRNSHCKCPAMVKQIGRTFTRGKWKHEHLVGLNKSSVVSATGSKRKEREKKKQKVRKKEENRVPDYVIVKEGSKAGMDLLKDKLGYTYTMRKLSKNATKCNWICSIRNKHLRCPASVCQVDGTFTPGIYDHKHLPGEKTEKPAEVVIAYNQSFLRNSRSQAEDSEEWEDDEDEYYDDSDDDDDDDEDGFDYGDTSFGTIKRTSKNRKQDRREHPSFLGPTCTINLTKCDTPGCNCKLVHCPFCDKDHFKPAKPARVQDHLEMSHFAHGVQFDDYMIVKCFKDCGQKKFGHYHCVFCKEQIIKRTAYGRHLSRHMKKKGLPSQLLILPDSKFPDTINAYGYEIPICKKYCKLSEGKHFHCPKCNRVCKERSVTVNHVWRCLQAEKGPAEDDPVDLDDAEDYELEESLLKKHISIVKTIKDLKMKRCEERACCRNMYHCQLCPPSLYRPTYKQQLIVHYISHWKCRVPYKNYNILRCFQACLDLQLAPIKSRYHYHCPLCAKILRQRNTFQDHLSYCHYFNTGESVTIDCITDRAEDIDKITKELRPLMETVEYMEDRLTMEAKLDEALKIEASVSPAVTTRTRSSIKKEVVSDDEESGNGYSENEKNSPVPTPAVHTKFMKHLLAGEKSGLVFEDITGTIDDDEEESGRGPKHILKAYDMDLSMIFETASAVLSESLIKAFKKESSLKACLSIVTQRTDTKLLHTETDGRKIYMLTGKLDNLSLAQQLIGQLILSPDKPSSFHSHSEKLRQRAAVIKKEIEEFSEDDDHKSGASKAPTRKKPESYKEKMARIKKEKEKEKKASAGKSKTPTVEEKKKGKSKDSKDRSKAEKLNSSFPYSEIKEIIAASKKVDLKTSPSKGRRKGKDKEIVETPVARSSRGRPLPQIQDTSSSKTRSGKKKVEVPSVRSSSSKKQSKKESSSTPSRYSTRGIKVDYQKMSAGKLFIKEEVISDEEGDGRFTITVENAESESEVEEKVQGKRRKQKGESHQRASVMVNPVTDSETSEDDDGGEAENEEADDSLSDMSDYEGADTAEPFGSSSKAESIVGSAEPTIDSALDEEQSGSEDKQELDSGKSDDEKLNKNEPKVMVEKLATVSPVKSGLPSPVKKMPQVITKRVVAVSPGKTGLGSSVVVSRGDQPLDNQDVKKAATVPNILNTGARKGSMVSRKRPAGETINTSMTKRPKGDGDEQENLEISEGIDNTLVTDLDESGLSKDNLKCSLCDFVAEAFPGLTEHLISNHNVTGPPRCDVCELDFASGKQLDLHLDKKHGPRTQPAKFKCGACESIFSSKQLCQSHISRVHMKKDKTGEEQKKASKYSCKKCEFTSTAAQDFYDHMKIEHGEEIVCDVCEKTFSNIHNLKLHQETVHLKNKTAACYVCGKHFDHIRYLKAHMEIHSDTHKFSCSKCERRFSCKASLIAHQETHKPKEERTYKYVCNFCGKQYLLKSNYEDHLNKHTGEKPYHCKLCNRSFGFRSMLVKHNIYIHSSDRPYRCGQCQKGFKFQRLLNNHMTTHTMVSKHVCSKCFKSFTTKSSLKVHEQKCTGILSKQHVPTVGKGSTLILYTDGRPNVFQLAVGNEQLVTTSEPDGMSTIVSIPDQPVVQDQILTEVYAEPTNEFISVPAKEELTQDLMSEELQLQSIVTGSEVPIENAESVMEGNLEMQPDHVAEIPTPGQQNTPAEVYACSECNSMFNSLNEAESHILTAHAQQVIS